MYSFLQCLLMFVFVVTYFNYYYSSTNMFDYSELNRTYLQRQQKCNLSQSFYGLSMLVLLLVANAYFTRSRRTTVTYMLKARRVDHLN